MYSAMKEDTVWSFDRLQSYINEKYAKEKELPENWVFTAFTVSMNFGFLVLQLRKNQPNSQEYSSLACVQ